MEINYIFIGAGRTSVRLPAVLVGWEEVSDRSGRLKRAIVGTKLKSRSRRCFMMKRSRKSLVVISFALVVIGVVAIEASWAAEQRTVKFGFPAPLSGARSGFGESFTHGLTMAVEEINQTGGILGHKVELIPGDVEVGEAAQVLNVFRKLIGRDKVDIITTGGTNEAMVEYALVEQMKIPYLLVWSSQTHLKVMEKANWKYKYIHNYTTRHDPYQTQFPDMVRSVIESGKFKPINKNIAVIKSNNEYSFFCGNGIRDSFKSMGFTTVIDETIPWGARFSEFAPIMAKIRTEKPAFIVYTDQMAANSAAFLLEFIQDPTPSIVYMQSAPTQPEFKEITKGRQKGIFWTYMDPFGRPQFKEYEKKFQKRWGKSPNPYEVYTYDVAFIAKEAMKKSGDPFNKDAVNNVFLSKDFAYSGVGATYVQTEEHLGRIGPGFFEYVTRQEQGGDMATTVWPLNAASRAKDSEFQLPPWYAAALKKYGN